jgi:addiction module HigA family antidote
MAQEVVHPGSRIRAEVMPKGMSVTAAAALVGVGRPALSNLLNGKAALTADMATRLEKAFNFPREDLLKMQASYDAAQAKKKNAPPDIKAHVPPFLGIKANQIVAWADHNIPARSRLAVLLRTLIHSTGRALSKVDFPGNDDAERPGWDGVVEAGEGTPWIPEGCSGWEFGTNVDIATKAKGDFEKSVKNNPKKERQQTTFVFVTPRRWEGKADWVAQAKKKKAWKDVVVYDASDLEQWLEQSIPGQVWLANETQLPASGVRSLDRCWNDWAAVASPPLTGALFGPAVDAARRSLAARLKSPPGVPTVITADSTEEALAFLSHVFEAAGDDELNAFRDRMLVFDKPGVLPRLAEGVQSFIAVAYTRDVERELGPHAKSVHSIVVYPRNVADTEPTVVLEPVGDETFTKGLEAMGKGRDEIKRLANESGRSLTVLRRRLATIPAVKTPAWAADPATAASLVPFLLVGAWHSRNDADKLALSLLADRAYPELEGACQQLAQLDDAPMWSIGNHRGVLSKIDLLYAVARFVTPQDLERYFELAGMVLGEDNPALDLNEDQRWAAAIYGKSREFSSTFREGISETLVLLAVYGPHLFKDRLGVDTEAKAARLVRELLPVPLTTRILEANDHDLPTYAEAAPGEFLSILERDLKSAAPAVYGLLRPATSGFLGHPSRTGLLWALEGLSWSPETLPRAALILAQLAQIEINDNWVNTPMNSLDSILRSWMPQTAATTAQRVSLVQTLTSKYPEIAWKICIGELGSQGGIGHYSHKPRWRPDGYGFGDPVKTMGPIAEFNEELLKIVLNWKPQTLGTLCDLVKLVPRLRDADQGRVWALVETWAKDVANDADKAALREQIRVATLSRRAVLRGKKDGTAAALSAKAKAAFAALEPSDVLNKHTWLFVNTWVEESADELEDVETFDHLAREKRIEALRIAAMREIKRERGLDGLLALVGTGKAASYVGFLAARDLLSESELQQLIEQALRYISEDAERTHPLQELIAGALGISDPRRENLLQALGTVLSGDGFARLLVLAPFTKSTWTLVDTLSAEGQASYWANVTPRWIFDGDASESVERLIKAGRPRAAFACIHFSLDQLDSQVLYRLLSEIAKGGNEQQYLLEPYRIEEAFEHLNRSQAFTVEQKAVLEFAFLDALVSPAGREGGAAIPNLERYIEAHPEAFVHGIVAVFRRKDGGVDPPEAEVPATKRKAAAERWFKLLEALERIPGHDDVGVLGAERLMKWVETVRQSCSELGRAEIGDEFVGRLLANAPVGEDGVWPCEPVRQVMEATQSEAMMSGAHTGVYNARGVHARGEGGGQERELAEKYRKWGLALQFSHPYVSANLLMRLAATYEREGHREDTVAGIRRRLPGYR